MSPPPMIVVLTLFISRSVCEVEGLQPAATLVLTTDFTLGFSTFSFAIKVIERKAKDKATICFTLLFIKKLFLIYSLY